MTTPERNPLIDSYVLMAWEILRENNQKGERHPAIHTTWTPFNKLFRELFPTIDPVAYTQMLQREGLIDIAVMRGGVLLKPRMEFLLPAPPEHRETIARFRKLLEATAKKRRDEQLVREAKKLLKPKPTSAALKAYEAGDTTAALKKLGY